MPERRAIGPCPYDVPQNKHVAYGHYCLNGGLVATVYDVLVRQQVGGRYRHYANLVQRHHGYPPLYPALEYQHDAVPAFQSQGEEIRSHAVREPLQLAVVHVAYVLPVVRPQQAFLLGVLLGVCIHHFVGEVEILRDVDLEVFHEVGIVPEVRLRQIFL